MWSSNGRGGIDDFAIIYLHTNGIMLPGTLFFVFNFIWANVCISPSGAIFIFIYSLFFYSMNQCGITLKKPPATKTNKAVLRCLEKVSITISYASCFMQTKVESTKEAMKVAGSVGLWASAIGSSTR